MRGLRRASAFVRLPKPNSQPFTPPNQAETAVRDTRVLPMAGVSPHHARLDSRGDLRALGVGCPTELKPQHTDSLTPAACAHVRLGDGPDFTCRSTFRRTPIHGLGL